MNNGLIDGIGSDRLFTAEPWRTVDVGGANFGAPEATGAEPGAAISWPGSANTLTGWTEIIAASPYDACILFVQITGGQLSGNETSGLIDISTGGTGSESSSILIDGIPIYGHAAPFTWTFPVRIASGTRFSFRAQTAAASLALSIRVNVGFVRDIPDYPSGTSVVAVGTIARASSTYTNISNACTAGLRRNQWATVGDLPAGKVIYLIPSLTPSTASFQPTHCLSDWGWLDQSGIAVNTQVGPPREIWAADVAYWGTSAEIWDGNRPTVWIPEGYRDGCVVLAVDQNQSLNNKAMCFAVVE